MQRHVVSKFSGHKEIWMDDSGLEAPVEINKMTLQVF